MKKTKQMQQEAVVINVHDTLPPVEMMHEIQMQVVTGDGFINPGVNNHASQLSTQDGC